MPDGGIPGADIEDEKEELLLFREVLSPGIDPLDRNDDCRWGWFVRRMGDEL